MAAETAVVAPPAAADAPGAPAPGPAAPVPLSAADDALAAATAANQAMLVARARDHTATPHFGESQDQELRGQPAASLVLRLPPTKVRSHRSRA